MIATSIKFRGHRCFKDEFVGFDRIMPINVIIGRNNTGKSHLLNLVQTLCEDKLLEKGWEYRCEGILAADDLQRVFVKGMSGDALPGNYWDCHGRVLSDKKVVWEIDENRVVKVLSQYEKEYSNRMDYSSFETELKARLAAILANPKHTLNGKSYRRLAADRDIQPEEFGSKGELSENGDGATDIIRRFLTTSDTTYPEKKVREDLLAGLQKIFGDDADFTEILVKIHDSHNSDNTTWLNHWEVYLREKGKDLVSMSKSGSGLKTVILVLLNLLIIPGFGQKVGPDMATRQAKHVFALEELENNLHPALLRRLLRYIQEHVLKYNCTVFLTTHSSVTLDFFSGSEHSQIISVSHDRKTARVTTLETFWHKQEVISELGAKPSDLLQANGIIWVEGPSDRVYLNHWISLIPEHDFVEGRNYQCVFYGGALISRLQATAPDDEDKNLLNLIRVNANIALVCDSDRKNEDDPVKKRVRRISEELTKNRVACTWITRPREIENYLPGEVIRLARKLDLPVNDPKENESFWPKKRQPSVWSRIKGDVSLDKVEFAESTVCHTTYDLMKDRFDWKIQMEKLVATIAKWNC